MAATAGAKGRPRTLLRCAALRIGYGGRALVPPIDLELSTGQVLLVVGRNGAGKSTWLKTVLGLIPAVGGRVSLGEPRPRISYVPQAAELDPLLPIRARSVVDWGRLRGFSFLNPLHSAADRNTLQSALTQANAADFADRSFRDLSGGQKQRVLMARLLASDAQLALLDEPTASLDLASERATYDRIRELANERGLGVVVVTHTLDVAAPHADLVLFLDGGERREDGVSVCGPPSEVFAHPLFRHHFGEHFEDPNG